ncbi:TolC family protein, partial [uncultured Acidaminococcus sp.]|jgi:outer membrane protein TolC
MARTDEARAALKPRFSILGLLGFATLGGGLFSAGSQGFAVLPQISYPLFHGGALKKNIAVQKAAEKEKKALYEKMVLKAAGEVRASMAAIAEDHAASLTLQKGRDASHEAYDLVRHNYHSGLGTYLDVLDAQRTYLQADQKYTVSKGKELSSLVSLFKALGGGWGPLEEANGGAARRHKTVLTDGGLHEEKGNEAHERIHQ